MNADGTTAFQVGDEVAVASSWKLKTSLASRTIRVGTIVEVLGEAASARYRIRWSNHGGGESIYRPTGASMRLAAERPDPGFVIS